jgi:hypothetical protein
VKGQSFDAVAPDRVDSYTNITGFPLTAAHTYNRWIASTAHSMGMSVALKNDLDQVADLVSDFDFALDEQCFKFSECDKFTPFISANSSSQANAMNLHSPEERLGPHRHRDCLQIKPPSN